VSDPTSPIPIATFGNGNHSSIHLVNNRIYVTDTWEDRLLVLPSLPGVNFTIEIDATPDTPFMIEGASSLNSPLQWTPLLTTNSSAMPFYFTDLVIGEEKKFYRVKEESK